MKTKEELNALKEEIETVSKKLAELTKEELAQVTGGYLIPDPEFPAPERPDPVRPNPERPVIESPGIEPPRQLLMPEIFTSATSGGKS